MSNDRCISGVRLGIRLTRLANMEKDVTAILRRASERGLPSLLIGGNAVILLGYIRNTVDLDLLLPGFQVAVARFAARARLSLLARSRGFRAI